MVCSEISFVSKDIRYSLVRLGELVQPLVNLLSEKIIDGRYLQMDEIRVQFLYEQASAPKAKATCGSAPGPIRNTR